ncbi:MAG: hypothetical protein K6U09_03225 [Acidobacteriia bacterium]|jgi:hypothetical protein|nr:hypothetical protein [Terriglobia bacterium]
MSRFRASGRSVAWRRLVGAVVLASLAGTGCAERNGSATRTADDQRVTVRGVLVRVAAIGGETTGWAIQLEAPLEMDGQTLHELEVNSQPERWADFEEKRVEASGRITWRRGVERGRWPVLEIESLRELSALDSRTR